MNSMKMLNFGEGFVARDGKQEKGAGIDIVQFWKEEEEIKAKQREEDVRLVVVSDTHNCSLSDSLFPAGDLLLHAGDLTVDGTREELEGAFTWLDSLASKYPLGCVVTAGNHDKLLDIETCESRDDAQQMLQLWNSSKRVRLLLHEEAVVAGIRIFGSPFTPLTPRRQALSMSDPEKFSGFSREESFLAQLYDEISENVQVLITHTPPFNLLDGSVQYGGVARDETIHIGSKSLASFLSKHSAGFPVHLFGHEHDARGIQLEGGRLSCNAAAVDGDRGVLKKGGKYKTKPGFR